MKEEIQGSSVLILGYGREGKSVHAWLKAQYPDVKIGIADKNVHTELISGEQYKGATVYNGEGYLFHLSEYDTVIRSPGISPYLPEIVEFVRRGGHMTSATNIFFSRVRGSTIGITGTKGKSTTSSLIAHILSAVFPDVRLVGNIGNPMLEALDGETPDTIYVIELSSHQLFDCRYSPHIAVVLGIVSEHLDYYPDLTQYAQAKSNITKHQTSSDFFVYNPTHTIVRELGRTSKGTRVTYGRQKKDGRHTYLNDGVIVVRTESSEIPVISMSDVPLLGNVENVLAAVTVSDLLRVPIPTLAQAITPFKSLPHRLEYVGEYRGVRFFNDSLATIPQATIHALEALGPDVATLIAGGYDRHLEFLELGAFLRSHQVSNLILFPDTGDHIWQSIGDVARGKTETHFVRKHDVQTMEQAVRLAYKVTPKGKICLLSPASASYNIFRDYADRGEQFKNWVRTLGEG